MSESSFEKSTTLHDLSRVILGKSFIGGRKYKKQITKKYRRYSIRK